MFSLLKCIEIDAVGFVCGKIDDRIVSVRNTHLDYRHQTVQPVRGKNIKQLTTATTDGEEANS
jgi:hypothetical protein